LKDLRRQLRSQQLLSSKAVASIPLPAAAFELWAGTVDPLAAPWASPASSGPLAFAASARTTRSGCKDLTEAIKLIKAAKRRHKISANVAKTWLATMHSIASAAGCSAGRGAGG
jgi:hypothetical protein